MVDTLGEPGNEARHPRGVEVVDSESIHSEKMLVQSIHLDL